MIEQLCWLPFQNELHRFDLERGEFQTPVSLIEPQLTVKTYCTPSLDAISQVKLMDEMDKALQNVSKEQGWTIKEILPLQKFKVLYLLLLCKPCVTFFLLQNTKGGTLKNVQLNLL